MQNTKIPVTILTGFLGSGKTTLLNRILSENHGKKIAVIENEFGEIGVDNELVIGADEEIFEMNNGCICCTVRGDLIRILTQLTKRKDKLDMIIVETTGMANPAPVAQTFWVDDEMQDQFSLDAIITMVDAKHVHLHLEDSDECKEQIAFADVVLLNKTDLVTNQELETLEKRIRAINALTKIYTTQNAAVDLSLVLNVQAFDLNSKIELNPEFANEEYPFEAIVQYQLEKGEYQIVMEQGPDPSFDLFYLQANESLDQQKRLATLAFSGKTIEQVNNSVLSPGILNTLVTTNTKQVFQLHIENSGSYVFFTQHGPEEFNMRLVQNEQLVEPSAIVEIEHTHSHDDEVTSIGLQSEKPLNEAKFGRWIGNILQTKGVDIFRSKGILYFDDIEERVVFQGVHMLFDAQPDRLWKPTEKKRNELIFIGKNLDRKELQVGFENCLLK